MIRLATIEDAETIAGVHVRTWQFAYEGIVPAGYLASLSILERANMWRRVISEQRNTALVAITPRGGVGFVSFGPSHGKDAKEKGKVYAIYVLPEFWNQGIGGELLEEAEERLADFAAVTLWVLEKNVLGRRFYETRGFRFDETRKEETIGGSVLTELRYEKRLGRSEIL
jgi:ribosomal protein S18 acetylase RimI-like enzyme